MLLFSFDLFYISFLGPFTAEDAIRGLLIVEGRMVTFKNFHVFVFLFHVENCLIGKRYQKDIQAHQDI